MCGTNQTQVNQSMCGQLVSRGYYAGENPI